jgi:hypothetical protein
VPAFFRSTALRDHLQRERHDAPRRFDTSFRARPPASASYRPQRYVETEGQPSVRKTMAWSAGGSDLDERPSRRSFRADLGSKRAIEITGSRGAGEGENAFFARGDLRIRRIFGMPRGSSHETCSVGRIAQLLKNCTPFFFDIS